LIVFSISKVALQAGFLMGDGLNGMFDTSIIAILLNGPMGDAVGLRLLGAVAVIAGCAVLLRRPKELIAAMAALIGAFMMAGSFAFTGHALTDPSWAAQPLVFAHVVMAAFWLGAFSPLLSVATKGDTALAGEEAHLFGVRARIAVGILVVAGVLLILRYLGSPLALPNSSYGVALIAKLSLIALLIALAAYNALNLTPRMRSGDILAVKAFRRSVYAETMMIIAIVTATSAATTVYGLP